MAKPTKKTAPYAVEQRSRNVHVVRMAVAGRGWEQWFLLSSDRHHDHPACDHGLERRHLQQAADRGAGVIDAGDLFDAMGGKFDKRSNKSALREEHKHGDYLDALVRTAADFYGPFARHWVVLGQGNHETAILNRHETNISERLVERLNARHGGRAFLGGYGGWVRFQFTVHGSQRTSRTLYYFHGSGGGGPVTRGVIQTNRLAVFNPDADVVLSGHTHDDWIVPIPRQRLSDRGVPYKDEQTHVRTPGYKDAWGDSYGGWDVEKMLGPKGKGSAWLRFYYEDGDVRHEVTRAN